MRYPIAVILLSVLLISNIASAQNSKVPPSFVMIPAGKVTMSGRQFSIETFYMLDHEVTNAEYKAFLAWLEQNKMTAEKLVCTPSLSKADWKLLPKGYFKSNKFNAFPVVGITQVAIEYYLQYLLATHAELGGLYRLPHEREWVYAARGGSDHYSYSCGNDTKNMENKVLLNYKGSIEPSGPMASISMTANGFKLYHMSGNVAEWLNAPSRTKGGSWNDGEESLLVTGKDPYMGTSSASPFIGFRVAWTPIDK